MTADNRSDLSKILKQRRVMIPLKLKELAAAAGISPSYLGRIERGERFPSAHILRKIARPLGFEEGELFTLAGYLPRQPSTAVERSSSQLDPLVAALLSQESADTQRAVTTILSVLKYIAKCLHT